MTSAITEIQKGGYFVEVYSWENDLDFPRVKCMGGLSKEEAQAIREVCNLFAPHDYQKNKNTFGNTEIADDDYEVLFDYCDLEAVDHTPVFDAIFEIADKNGADRLVVWEGVQQLIGMCEAESFNMWRVVQWVRVFEIGHIETREIF